MWTNINTTCWLFSLFLRLFLIFSYACNMYVLHKNTFAKIKIQMIWHVLICFGGKPVACILHVIDALLHFNDLNLISCYIYLLYLIWSIGNSAIFALLPFSGPINITSDTLNLLPCSQIIPDDRPEWEKVRCIGTGSKTVMNHRFGKFVLFFCLDNTYIVL